MNSPNSVSGDRNIDMVFCIDGTGSMTPCIDNIKKNARRFYGDFAGIMMEMGSKINMLRIKVIVFRDYKSDGQNAMVESSFFELPAEEEDFSNYLESIKAFGGCDEDANGLEALYRAMRSDFSTGDNDRQVIVLFADTTAIPLRKRRNYDYYPRDMVDEEGLLRTWWCRTQDSTSKLRERNKRLVIFAPRGSCYEEMYKKYNRCCFMPVEIHNGLDEISFREIINSMASSASSVS